MSSTSRNSFDEHRVTVQDNREVEKTGLKQLKWRMFIHELDLGRGCLPGLMEGRLRFSEIRVFLAEKADINGEVNTKEVAIPYRKLKNTSGAKFFQKIPLLLSGILALEINLEDDNGRGLRGDLSDADHKGSSRVLATILPNKEESWKKQKIYVIFCRKDIVLGIFV